MWPPSAVATAANQIASASDAERAAKCMEIASWFLAFAMRNL
jgi:hypothetical protein